MGKYIGIDIGTTTICTVCLDEAGQILSCDKRENRTVEFARQDPEAILADIRELIAGMQTEQGSLAGIGISTQMHGIVYVDEYGKSCSPLYTWQDSHGNDRTAEGNETYCEELSRITGYQTATGYGLCTHYYHVKNQLVPRSAHKICTIGDYAAMQLGGLKEPLMHSSNAAGLGMFDTKKNTFDLDAIRRAGINPDILPEVLEEDVLGTTPEGVKVWTAIGDNQASVYGTVPVEEGIPSDSVQITVGTSAQITFVVPKASANTGHGLEVRPFLGGKQLLVGAALCGGYAYQLLRDFFAETLRTFGDEPTEKQTAGLYARMNQAAGEVQSSRKTVMLADTRFLGSRKNPALAGAFTGIRPENFHPGELCLSVLKGIVEELYSFCLMKNENQDTEIKTEYIYGSGNGLRQNPLLVKLFEERFQAKLLLYEITEEAAYGAGKYASEQEKTYEGV